MASYAYVPQQFDNLLRFFCNCERGCVYFFEGVCKLGWMHDDHRLAQGGRKASVKGRVPLLVLVTEPYDNNIGVTDECTRANGIELTALVVFPESICFFAENFDAAIVAGVMIRNG
jgi:hypothetical protein